MCREAMQLRIVLQLIVKLTTSTLNQRIVLHIVLNYVLFVILSVHCNSMFLLYTFILIVLFYCVMVTLLLPASKWLVPFAAMFK